MRTLPAPRVLTLAILLVAGGGCGSDGTTADAEWWRPPAYWPTPLYPADNPMSTAKVELGRRLFYDTRLSVNGTYSCASCHRQELAFTDGRARAEGATGQVHRRSSMALGNVAYASALTWANPLMATLEKQALVPMFGETPVELGLVGREAKVISDVAADTEYPARFAAAFPESGGAIGIDTIVKAIAAFERALLTYRSPYDRYASGQDAGAISASARRGEELFFSETLECHHCHGGFNFMDSVTHTKKAIAENFYHNTGLYNLDGQGAYPAEDIGLAEVTDNLADMGRFRSPSLRNIAVTAPYMHDGSIATLREVITQHYARGGRLIASGPTAGDGRLNPRKSPLLNGFSLDEAQINDVIAFLESLTDQGFLEDPHLADPFAKR